MNSTNALTGAGLAAAVALALAGCASTPSDPKMADSMGGKVSCKEANTCKTTATCAGVAMGQKHDCKGKNACGGNVRQITKEECDGIKGSVVASRLAGMDTSLGQGIGLRASHFDEWCARPPDVGWAECITENFLDVGGRPREALERVRRDRPLVLHGVSLSIGSVDPLNRRYLASVRRLADELAVEWVSDHLCWASVDGQYLHDLLPLPYSEEALLHVCERVEQAQAVLGRPLVLENPSTYVRFAESTMDEQTFLSEVARRTGAGILLDINNVYVSARNFGFDASAYLEAIPRGAVWQFHLAGHTDLGTHVIDTHDGPVCDAVWGLYRQAVERFGAIPTLIEWDASIPSLEDLVAESKRAGAIEAEVLGRRTLL